MNNSFYDDKDLREIDEQISEVIGQPTLVDQMQERNDKVQSAKTNWANEFRQYWYIYLPLLVSSIFTTMLGLYMGLAPYLKTAADGSKTIEFNTDWSHVLTAIVYVVAFVYVTEVAFAIFHNLFHKREDTNGTQQGTMLFGMILAGVSIIGTGISGGTVVASTLGFLTEFKEIPHSAQVWVVRVIPVMLGLYAGLFIAYKLSSRKAKAERLARENEDRLELDNQVRMRGIKAIGKRRIQAAAIQMYEEMVMRGLLSPTEADWALNSGLSLAEIEKKLGRDLTGEGKIGGGTYRPGNHPTPSRGDLPERKLYGEPQYYPVELQPLSHGSDEYTLEDVAKFARLPLPNVVTALQQVDPSPIAASLTLIQFKQMGLLPDDMMLGNFVTLVNQAGSLPKAAPQPIKRGNGQNP